MASLPMTIIETLGSPFSVSGWVDVLAGVADKESIIPLLLLYGMTTSQKRGCKGS
jgi:hypothetical protein